MCVKAKGFDEEHRLSYGRAEARWNWRIAAHPPFSELGVGDRRAATLSDGLRDATASCRTAFRADRRPDRQQN